MRNAKRSIEGKISVDGIEFTWRVHREPQWCTQDGWRGLVLSFHQIDASREALVEWPMPKSGNSVPYRQRPKIDTPLLKAGIQSALASGWEPLSRGKSITVLVD
jgi:hypothetical protein